MEDWPYRLVAFAGYFTIAFIAWLTGRRSRLNWRTILGSVASAWDIGVVTFWLPGSRWVLVIINDMVVAMLTASQKGSLFLLGPLALGPGETLPDGTKSVGFILAMQALPAVVFFAALMAGLYYLGIMQAIVGLFARLFHRTMGLSGAESLSGAANIFVGIEAGLIVQPYLAAHDPIGVADGAHLHDGHGGQHGHGHLCRGVAACRSPDCRPSDFRLPDFYSLCGAHQ